MIVVDTNVIGYLYLTSERSGQAEQAFLQDPHWAAPLLWRSELRNVLAMYMRRRILSLDEAQRIMDQAMGVMARHEYEVTSMHILSLAAASSCSAYDCEFVALAEDLRVPLITVDQELLERFPRVAMSLEDFVVSNS